jgi:NAD(P)-dependent dehydrogenase (short-subunit alcohol dehydrogenase family)
LAASVGATTVELDGSCFEAVDLAVERAQQQLGRLDGVVNCAGSLLLKPAHRTTQTEYREVLSANLDTAFALVRAGARAMMQTGGSIVLVSSVAARVGLANHEAIAAAKSGIQGLALAAAASYAPRGIRVNVVAPGLTRTPLTADLLRSQAAEAASVAMHPLGRLGEPGDVAAAIHWLLDARQSWITGQVLGVDGGLGSVRGR